MGSTDAFVWLRLYQVELAQEIPRGRRNPLWCRARFPARPPAAGWPATRQDREQVFDRLTRSPFLLDSAGSQKQRRRGLGMLLEWLSAQPGQSWQDRWPVSGADTAGADWRRIPAQWLRAEGRSPQGRTGLLCAALTVDQHPPGRQQSPPPIADESRQPEH